MVLNSILWLNTVVLTSNPDRMLSFDIALVWSVGLNILNVAGLAFILYKILYGPVKKFLAERAARVQAQIDDAETMLRDAQGFKSEYSTKLSEIDVERTSILDTVRKRALTDEAAIIKKANEQAESLKHRANEDIEREKDKAQDEMKKQIIELSTILTMRYISGAIDSEQQNRLLDNIIEEMRAVRWQI